MGKIIRVKCKDCGFHNIDSDKPLNEVLPNHIWCSFGKKLQEGVRLKTFEDYEDEYYAMLGSEFYG